VTGSGDEHAGEFAVQLALLPELAGSIPESLQNRTKPQPHENQRLKKLAYLPLSGEVTVASGDTVKDTVIVSEVVGSKDGIVRLGGRIHLGQNLLGQSLGNPKIKQVRQGNV
jgi:hypothetical protein